MKKLLALLILLILFSSCVYAVEDEIDSNDLYILSHIINAEAGDSNCSHEHRIAVGSVVLNRVADPDFPDTIYDVVFQPGQYSPTWNGAYEKLPSED